MQHPGIVFTKVCYASAVQSCYVCCGQTAGWIKMPLGSWYKCRHRPGQHCVRCGPSSIPKGQTPQISAHVCCGQTAGWIKMPLGTNVRLSPDRIVLHGDPAVPLKRGTAPTIFGPYLLWPNSHPFQLLLSTCN